MEDIPGRDMRAMNSINHGHTDKINCCTLALFMTICHHVFLLLHLLSRLGRRKPPCFVVQGPRSRIEAVWSSGLKSGLKVRVETPG